VQNYRSLRHLVMPLRRLTLVTGANGTGKSSLYRALRLLADASRNGAIAALAREGGLPSTLWAGPEVIGQAVRSGQYPVQGTRRTKPVGLRLGFGGDEYGYALDLGLPVVPMKMKTAFELDPEIKRESIWGGPVLRPSTVIADRHNEAVRIRDEDGRWNTGHRIALVDSILSEVSDPRHAPEVLLVRERLRSWRFYDQFRTDPDAPARAGRIGTRTPILGHDGADLPAALQTIREDGDTGRLDDAVDHAFPGSRFEIVDHDGRFELRFHQHGLLRPLAAAELSDGTLRYLLWTAAMLTTRPPELFVLNEPETSLHPDLLAPLAELIRTAATRTQLIVVSHSTRLVAALQKDAEASTVVLVKEFGETLVEGQGRLDAPAWHWPKR
jgi:predicted ATPase